MLPGEKRAFYGRVVEAWCARWGATAGCNLPKQDGSEELHAVLDLAGLVPGFGELADGLNAIIYAAQGAWGNAALSLAGMVPVAGSAAVAFRLAQRAQKTCNSFDPETPVLMADGATKKIKDIDVDDHVLAADEKTGNVGGGRKVIRLHANPHDGDLIDVVVADHNGSSRTIRTTAEHLFWDNTAKAWVPAAVLVAGHELRSEDGQAVQIRAVGARPGSATMLDLTVAELHTYYVLAGDTPVLVHNCNASVLDPWQVRDRVRLHVMGLHGYGTGSTGSKFARDIGEDDVMNLVHRGVNQSTMTGVMDATGGHLHQYDTGRVIGEVDGTPTTYVNIWMRPDGAFGTIHPTLR
jgi:hypothetical protein